MKRTYVLTGLGILAALALVSPAVGGPSLKSLVEQEVAKQLEAAKSAKSKKGKRGPPGPAGPAGSAGQQGPQGPAGSAANLTVEPFHLVGGAGEPAFQNAWVNTAAPPSPPASFYKDPLGIVHLRGVVSNGGSSTTIFTLPVGYRPGANERFPAILNSVPAVALVQTTGDVSMSTGGNLGATLNGITFRAEN